MIRTVFAALAALLLAGPASAATIASYSSSNGETLPVEFAAPGVTAGDIMRGPGLSLNRGETFNSRGWTVGGDADTAFDNGDFLFVDFTFDKAYDLTTLDVGYDRSNTGPKSIALDLIVNGTAFLNFFVDDAVAVGGSFATLDLSRFTAVTSLSIFGIGYNATSAAGTFDLENRVGDDQAVILSGDLSQIAPVPLPAGLPLLAGGMVLLVGLRRRRRG